MGRPLVLVIEDDPDIGSSLVEVLAYLDVYAEWMADGSRAYQTVVDKRPALILLDIHLPGKSGLEIMDEIRADPLVAHTRIAIVTADAYLGKEIRQKADGILLKPYTIDQLNALALHLLAN
jgi:CheY-like chemotaxis protein